MSEEDKKENLCANCKYKMRGWKCLVKGSRYFESCEDYRFGNYCRGFESKKAGRTKSEDQLAVAHEVSCIAAIVCSTLLILGFFGLLVALAVLG